MEQETKKRTRRSKEEVINEKIAMLEEKIASYKTKIAEAEKQIEQLRNPPAPSVKKKDIWSKADEYGLSAEEVMELVERAGKKKTKE